MKGYTLGILILSLTACSVQQAKQFIPKVVDGTFIYYDKIESNSELTSIFKKEKTPLLIVNNNVYLTPDDCLCNRNSGGDAESRSMGGDDSNRKMDGDKDKRLAGGDMGSRNLGGDAGSRDSGGDTESRNSGGDTESRNSGGDTDTRKSGGDTDTRKLGGDIDDRDLAGDKSGRKSGGEQESRNASGDQLSIGCRLKKPCDLKLINSRENLKIFFYDEFGLREVEGGLISIR